MHDSDAEDNTQGVQEGASCGGRWPISSRYLEPHQDLLLVLGCLERHYEALQVSYTYMINNVSLRLTSTITIHTHPHDAIDRPGLDEQGE